MIIEHSCCDITELPPCVLNVGIYELKFYHVMKLFLPSFPELFKDATCQKAVNLWLSTVKDSLLQTMIFSFQMPST